MTKQEAYKWLSEFMGLPMASSHIGMMGEYYCQQVIDECQKVLARNGGEYFRPMSKSGGENHAAYC